MSTISYAEARDHLEQILDEVVANREPVVIQRQGFPDVALFPADELSSLRETAYLLRSPKNAERLLGALQRARESAGKSMSLEDLKAAADFHGADR